jgi:hypothetical protein
MAEQIPDGRRFLGWTLPVRNLVEARPDFVRRKN